MSQVTTKNIANRLIHETSPYLLQHAHNPVDWHPWGEEALQKAKAENKPIFLSIGYSACHWCHVMERESFENEQIAALMNESFINIKVDREERPDLDHIYQTSCQLITGQGGWPLSVFLTPDLRPFFAGTYYPPHDKYGRPGFARLLKTLRDAYRDDPDGIAKTADELTTAIAVSESANTGDFGASAPKRDLVAKGVRFLEGHVDKVNGGFGIAPKFPNTANLQLFLQQHGSHNGERFVQQALHALQKMAAGGIYDHLGGGFHRYSTDARWLIPHFEKMLYDNALLPPLYLAAYQITGDEAYAQVARETLDFILRDMTDGRGGFYSTIDADSEGEEGKYYVWRLDDLHNALGEQEAQLFAQCYGVTEKGNFEHGASVLHQAQPLSEVANKLGMPIDEAEELIWSAKRKLLAERGKRIPPFRDEKILAGWNGLMISALAKGAIILGESRYAAAAASALRFIENEMRFDDGRLRHSWKDRPGSQPGFLEDYAFVCQACIDTYTATFDSDYLATAADLMRICLDRFWDQESGGFYLAEQSADLIHRPKSARDQSTPSGNGVAAQALLRLHSYAPDDGFGDRAEALFAAFHQELAHNPWGTATLLATLDLQRAGFADIVVVKPCQRPHWNDSLLAMIRSVFLPNVNVYAVEQTKVVAPESPAPCHGKKTHDGQLTAYICQDYTCSAPVTTVDEMKSKLASIWQPAI